MRFRILSDTSQPGLQRARKDILTAKNAGFVAGILVTLFGLYLYTLHYRGSMLTEDQAETARLIKLKDHDDPARDREVAERGHPIL